MDKIWQWIEKIPLYKWLNGHRLFGKIFNREVLLYLVFGVLTTVVSLVTFWIPDKLFHAIGYQGVVYYLMRALHIAVDAEKDFTIYESNTISWICAVAFAFVTNKRYVFESEEKGASAARELFAFAGGRLGTLVIDQGLMTLFAVVLSFPNMIAKIIVQVVIVILNYFISKLLVFRKRAEPEEPPESEAPADETQASADNTTEVSE